MKETKMKKVKGGFVALLATCLLTVNLAPAIAGGWGDLIPFLYEVIKEVKDGGGERIRCYSASYDGAGHFVECSTCLREVGRAKGIGVMCTRNAE